MLVFYKKQINSKWLGKKFSIFKWAMRYHKNAKFQSLGKYTGASWTVAKRETICSVRHFLRKEKSSNFNSHLSVKVCKSHFQSNSCYKGVITSKFHFNMILYLFQNPSKLTVINEKIQFHRNKENRRVETANKDVNKSL